MKNEQKTQYFLLKLWKLHESYLQALKKMIKYKSSLGFIPLKLCSIGEFYEKNYIFISGCNNDSNLYGGSYTCKRIH